MTEGQGGGEFYTPAAIVRLLTEVIEPYHGSHSRPRVRFGRHVRHLCPLCLGSIKKNPSSELSIYGVGETDETGRLCRMNLAIMDSKATSVTAAT